MTQQPIFITWKSEANYSYCHMLMKENFENKKDFEVKKTPNTSSIYNSSGGRQLCQSGQTFGQSTQKRL